MQINNRTEAHEGKEIAIKHIVHKDPGLITIYMTCHPQLLTDISFVEVFTQFYPSIRQSGKWSDINNGGSAIYGMKTP